MGWLFSCDLLEHCRNAGVNEMLVILLSAIPVLLDLYFKSFSISPNFILYFSAWVAFQFLTGLFIT